MRPDRDRSPRSRTASADSDANPDSDANSDSDSNANANSVANSVALGHTNPCGYSYTLTGAERVGRDDSDSDTNRNGRCDPDSDRVRDCHTGTDVHGLCHTVPVRHACSVAGTSSGRRSPAYAHVGTSRLPRSSDSKYPSADSDDGVDTDARPAGRALSYLRATSQPGRNSRDAYAGAYGLAVSLGVHHSGYLRPRTRPVGAGLPRPAAGAPAVSRITARSDSGSWRIISYEHPTHRRGGWTVDVGRVTLRQGRP